MQSIIVANAVCYELPNGRVLFENLNFSLDSNLTALVGPNGVGKTSLAKLIAGELIPTTGTIRNATEVSFFHQYEKPQAVSVDDYLATRYSWSVLGEELLAGIDRSQHCTKLSGGQWMRVRLAAAIADQFLILDEPSNDLDRGTKNILRDFLKNYSHGILLVSHDRELLGLCDNILELSNRGLQKYGGGYLSYENAKQQDRERSLVELDRAKRDRGKAKEERVYQLKKQEKRNSRGAETALRGGMPKILLGARKRKAQETTGEIDKSTLRRADEKVQAAFEAYREIKVDPVMYLDLMGTEIPNQKLVAEVRNFNIVFSEWIYKEDLNFSWRGNIRLAIKGNNGSGKSTLIKAILGQEFKTRGEIRSGKLNTLYLDQRCSILDEEKNIFDNVKDLSTMSDSEIRNNLAKLLFFGDSVFQKVSSLSGGERLRAALACGLLSQEKPEMIILDEPTNNLDLTNIQFLESLISHFKGAIILISHDEEFLKKCRVEQALFL